MRPVLEAAHRAGSEGSPRFLGESEARRPTAQQAPDAALGAIAPDRHRKMGVGGVRRQWVVNLPQFFSAKRFPSMAPEVSKTRHAEHSVTLIINTLQKPPNSVSPTP
jgi:hypothetical protein